MAADASGRTGIVIAGDPQPVAPALQSRERGAVGLRHARCTAAVMKAVAERNHEPRRIARNQMRQAPERRRRVVGRQQHAARREGGAFLQMQIGDREQTFVRPEQRAAWIGDEGGPGR